MSADLNSNKRGSELQGMLLVICAAVLWGTTGTAQAFAPPESTPQVIGTLRLLVGGLFLALLAWLKDPQFYRGIPILPAVATGFFIAAYQICFFHGVALTGVAVGTIVGIGSSPIFAGILGIVFLRERLKPKWYIATLLALIGSALLVGSSGTMEVNGLGILLAMGAGLSYAGYTLLIKLQLPGRSAESITALCFCIGALLLCPILFTADLHWIFQLRGLLVTLHLGLFATALSYVLFSKGLAQTQVSTAVTLSLAEPVTAGLLGVLVVGERLSTGGWCGIVCILTGLAILALPSEK